MPRRRRRVVQDAAPPRVERREAVEVYEEGPPLPPPQRPIWPWLLLLALAVVGTLIGLWLWQDGTFDEEEATTVVVQTVGETETTETTETETVVTTTAPERPANATVPDVAGQRQQDAGATIEALGLKADSYPVASGEERGTVVAQRPAAGATAPGGSIVRLNVALGAGARAAREVPDVTGPKESDARAEARAAGFTVRTVDRDAPTSEEIGEVLTQEPAAGSTAPELTQITIYVGR